MRLRETEIDGVYLVHLEPARDHRGSFCRTFASDIFEDAGIDPHVAQCSVSVNPVSGTLRGMHFQLPPYEETKYLRCTRGKIFDVAVDVRSQSPTFGQWISIELHEGDNSGVVHAPGIAHGFLTLAEYSEVEYVISKPYSSEHAAGFRWDDPDVRIDWPHEPIVISDRDRNMPTLAALTRRSQSDSAV